MDERLQEFIKQYELAVAFAKEFEDELGEERALGIIGRAFEKIQVKAGQELAAELGSNGLDALVGYYRKRAEESDAIEIVEVTDKHIALKITRCRAWEAFKHLGAPEVCKMYCESDYAYIKAFNPDIKMIRTKTLSNGDDCCNHIWAMED